MSISVAPTTAARVRHAIETLGFRGEALASIGEVARLTIRSRTRQGGGCLTVDGGRAGEVTPNGGAVGTSVEVRSLFSATPARLKFMKSERAENMAVTDVVKRLVKSNPAPAA